MHDDSTTSCGSSREGIPEDSCSSDLGSYPRRGNSRGSRKASDFSSAQSVGRRDKRPSVTSITSDSTTPSTRPSVTSRISCDTEQDPQRKIYSGILPGEHGCLFGPGGEPEVQAGQTSEGSFSAVSTATIARVGAFFSDFSRSTRFSPLRTALNPKFQQKLAKFFPYFFQKFRKFC